MPRWGRLVAYGIHRVLVGEIPMTFGTVPPAIYERYADTVRDAMKQCGYSVFLHIIHDEFMRKAGESLDKFRTRGSLDMTPDINYHRMFGEYHIMLAEALWAVMEKADGGRLL